jgi:lysophospholipase L1-like esterase
MSCGGAVTRHLLHGGQYFQGPQIRTITRGTRLVTLTIGGNDVGYVADLSMLAARNTKHGVRPLRPMVLGRAPATRRAWLRSTSE